jgi:2-iminobutanoate/2-iminopropanoate deaminase
VQKRSISAPEAPQPTVGYAQAVEVSGAQRLLFISGQTPQRADGTAPEGFRAQSLQVWANIDAQLREAGMDRSNLVKLTTFLSDRAYNLENRVIRGEMLGDLKPAITVIIAGIFDAGWLLEIEAVAAA